MVVTGDEGGGGGGRPSKEEVGRVESKILY